MHSSKQVLYEIVEGLRDMMGTEQDENSDNPANISLANKKAHPMKAKVAANPTMKQKTPQQPTSQTTIATSIFNTGCSSPSYLPEKAPQ